MSRRGRKVRRKSAGRLFEVVTSTLLVLIVLAFGLSIAKRYGSEEERGPRVEPMRNVLPPEVPPDPEILRNRPTVDIRNGCGESGLAEQLMHRLRRAGFDVVEYRNADRYDYERTLVKDRSGKAEAATQLRQWLQREYGVGELVDDRVGVPEADLVLVIGADLADTLRLREARVR